MRADELLSLAQQALGDRAKTRDQDSERSMGLAVAIFGAMTGRSLSELDGWRFMIALKLARAARGQCHMDDWVDLAGYAALAGECHIGVKSVALATAAEVLRQRSEQDDDMPAETPAVNTGD